PLLLGCMGHPGPGLGLLCRAQDLERAADRGGRFDPESGRPPAAPRTGAGAGLCAGTPAIALHRSYRVPPNMIPPDARRRGLMAGAGMALAALPAIAAAQQASSAKPDRGNMLSAA